MQAARPRLAGPPGPAHLAGRFPHGGVAGAAAAAGPSTPRATSDPAGGAVSGRFRGFDSARAAGRAPIGGRGPGPRRAPGQPPGSAARPAAGGDRPSGRESCCPPGHTVPDAGEGPRGSQMGSVDEVGVRGSWWKPGVCTPAKGTRRSPVGAALPRPSLLHGTRGAGGRAHLAPATRHVGERPLASPHSGQLDRRSFFFFWPHLCIPR